MNITAMPVRTPGIPTNPRLTQKDGDDPKKDIDEHNFSWVDLGKGVTGSLISGTIDGTGAAVASLIKTPRIGFEAVRGIWTSKMLGPVLKTTLTPVVLAAGLAAPVFVTLGGIGYGMYEGFVEGSTKNPLAAASKSIETCKQMHGKVTQQVVDSIREMAAKTPNSPEEVMEIKVVEAGKGLISSVASAAIDGAGVGASVLVNTPEAYWNGTKAIWKSDMALPLKVGAQFLGTAAAILATPLGVVGGVLYGLGKGAYNGYSEGVLPGIGHAGKDVAEFHKTARKFVNSMD